MITMPKKEEKKEKSEAQEAGQEKKKAKTAGKARNIGIKVKNAPESECNDWRCPYHGGLPVRGKIFEGKVVSDKMDRGVVVEWGFTRFVKKFDRAEKKKSKVTAHNPPCIHARSGDKVRVAECRPLSKTKKFVVIEKL